MSLSKIVLFYLDVSCLILTCKLVSTISVVNLDFKEQKFNEKKQDWLRQVTWTVQGCLNYKLVLVERGDVPQGPEDDEE